MGLQVALRQMFPKANLSAMLAQRPTLLLDEEWPGGHAHPCSTHRRGCMLGQLVPEAPVMPCRARGLWRDNLSLVKTRS